MRNNFVPRASLGLNLPSAQLHMARSKVKISSSFLKQQ